MRKTNKRIITVAVATLLLVGGGIGAWCLINQQNNGEPIDFEISQDKSGIVDD